MKKITLLFSLFVSLLSFSQTQDLYTLAKGDFIGFNALFDENENLYGYVSIYGYGKSTDKTKKFEYVILDKNLNPVANNEFEGDITALDYAGYIDHSKLIITPFVSLHDKYIKRSYSDPREISVDMKTNTVSYIPFYEYDGENILESEQSKTNIAKKKEKKAGKRENNYTLNADIVNIDKGFVVMEYKSFSGFKNKDFYVCFFDKEKKKQWTFDFFGGNYETLKNFVTIKYVDSDDRFLYLMASYFGKKGNPKQLCAFDLQTGKLVSHLDVPFQSALTYALNSIDGRINNVENNDQNFTILTSFSGSFGSFNKEGFVKINFDKEKKEFSTFISHFVNDVYPKYPELTELKDPFDDDDLDFKTIKFLGENIVVISEKIARQKGKTSDLVMMVYDKNMAIKDLQIMKKGKASDYLFTQYLNDKKDMVFFYRDLQKDDITKEKNWKLFINTLIDGKFKQEELQISEKNKYLISPYVGKEGYILLREFNEKEKFNKIRLERLNY